MRERIMEGLRMAGQRLQDFDQMYSDAVKKRVYGDDPSGTRGIIGDALGGRWGDVEVDDELLQSVPNYIQAGARAYQYGVPAVGYTARYAAPAAGIALAGKGLMDIAGSFGGQADEPSPTTLPLNQY